MPAIQAEQLDGLIKTTLPHIVRERKASIAERLTEYIGLKRIFQPEKVVVQGGTSIEWNMTTDHANTAMQVGLFDTIAPATNLHQVKFNVPWRHSRSHVSWDLREVAMNTGDARILNYIKEKVFEMDVADAEHIEDQIWQGPAAGDDQSAFGVGYWVFPPSDGGTANTTAPFTTTSTGGRVNINHTNVSAGPGAVSAALYGGRHRPWYQNYATVNYIDLMDKMRRGFDEISFVAPVDYNKASDGNTRFGIYCTQEDARNFADEVRTQNENIGPDAAYYDGKAMIRGVVVTGVPKLNEIDAARATPQRPFYVLDWSQIRPVCLQGFAVYETTETGGSNQPLTVTRVRYRTWNTRAYNCKTMALFTSNAS